MGCQALEQTSAGPVSSVGGDSGFAFDQTHYMQLLTGMVLAQVDFPASAQHAFSQVRINKPLIEFSFHLAGHAKGSLSNSLHTYCKMSVGPGTTLVSYNPEAMCGIQLMGGERFQALNLYLPPRLLGELLGDELATMPKNLKAATTGDSALPFNMPGDLDPEMKMIVHQIMNCPLEGAVGKIYIEGKALELIALRLAQFKCSRCHKCNCPRLKQSDMDKIHEAKRRLLASMDDPPSLASLAQQVGTNTTKLTEGFRMVFGTTAFEILRKERIIRARQALEEGTMNVTETAHHLGYSDSSHFIREFARYYGTTPGVYLKARR
jgi:AraC family transcriptional regulator, transcriptional activator of the genes for pyochelin and ferripyochelin receptors